VSQDGGTLQKIAETKARYAASVKKTADRLKVLEGQKKQRKKTPVKKMPIINFFDGNVRKGEYTRVYTHLVYLDPHELCVWINGDEYTFHSEVTLPPFENLLPGNVLRFFTYVHKNEKFQQLYPLPKDMRTPPAAAAIIRYKSQSGAQREAAIEAHSDVIAARAEYNAARKHFDDAIGDAYEAVAEQAKVGKASPELRDLLGVMVAKFAPSQAPASQAASAQAPATPATGSANTLTVNDSRPRVVPAQPEGKGTAPARSRKKSKVSKKQQKDRQNKVNRMFPQN
jgi:hypothetical protein